MLTGHRAKADEQGGGGGFYLELFNLLCEECVYSFQLTSDHDLKGCTL